MKDPSYWIDLIEKEKTKEELIVVEKRYAEKLYCFYIVMFAPLFFIFLIPNIYMSVITLFNFIILLSSSIIFYKKNEDKVLNQIGFIELMIMKRNDIFFSMLLSKIEKKIETERENNFKEIKKIDLELLIIYCQKNPTNQRLRCYRELKKNHNKYSKEVKDQKIKDLIEAEATLLKCELDTMITE